MSFLAGSIKYPSRKQAEFWSLRREFFSKGNPKMSTIAAERQISLAAVSQTLKKANKRIRKLLESTARSNKICLDIISPEIGYARGKSRIFKVKAYITYSPINGVNVWYDHEGDCETCEEQTDCRQILFQEFQERKLPILDEALQATELAEHLFRELEDLLK